MSWGIGLPEASYSFHRQHRECGHCGPCLRAVLPQMLTLSWENAQGGGVVSSQQRTPKALLKVFPGTHCFTLTE